MFAAIDIGTNSVLLLVAEVGVDGSVRAVDDVMTVTRLGEGLVRSGRISDAAAERTLECLRRYREICAERGVREICAERGVREIAAAGTAALRSAANAGDFLSSVRQELGLEIEVLSAEREAALTFRSCTQDFGNGIVVVDIGGGSTEVITAPHPDPLPTGERKKRRTPVPTEERKGEGWFPEIITVSLPVGSVVLTEQFLAGDPPTTAEVDALRGHVHRLLADELDATLFARPHDRELIATAGTATTLAAMHARLADYDSARIHGSRLSIDMLRDLIDALRRSTVAERMKMPGLSPERADVILGGAELLQELMSFLGYADLTISDRGLRWGLFEEKFCT